MIWHYVMNLRILDLLTRPRSILIIIIIFVWVRALNLLGRCSLKLILVRNNNLLFLSLTVPL